VPGYLTKTQTVAVGGVDTVVRSLLDRQQFSDPTGAAARAGISGASWPLFGLVWPSALVLAAHLQHAPLGVRRVLEVGCGLALASLVVHRRHGRITASDRHPLAESFLLENLRLNALAPMAYCAGDWATANPALGRFDLIVGSDVLYEPDQPGLLAAFIALHAQPSAEVLIADPDRGNRAAFTRAMGLLGFDCTHTHVMALPDAGGPYKGRLLRYLRSADAPVAAEPA
jgi:2-polyprenyl-3-methyl-5-hydroxy-6-metoxy-1,4-benzoquinol methylase